MAKRRQRSGWAEWGLVVVSSRHWRAGFQKAEWKRLRKAGGAQEGVFGEFVGVGGRAQRAVSAEGVVVEGVEFDGFAVAGGDGRAVDAGVHPGELGGGIAGGEEVVAGVDADVEAGAAPEVVEDVAGGGEEGAAEEVRVAAGVFEVMVGGVEPPEGGVGAVVLGGFAFVGEAVGDEAVGAVSGEGFEQGAGVVGEGALAPRRRPGREMRASRPQSVNQGKPARRVQAPEARRARKSVAGWRGRRRRASNAAGRSAAGAGSRGGEKPGGFVGTEGVLRRRRGSRGLRGNRGRVRVRRGIRGRGTSARKG
jgi:hypothetical protein